MAQRPPVSSIYGRQARELIGTVPFELDCTDPEFVSAQRRQYSNQLRSGEQKNREETVNLADAEHTLLFTGKPVRINNESLLLTASLDIMDRKHLDALKEPFCIEGHEGMTSASLGASIYPLHDRNQESLRRCDDSAMYRAKSSRKERVSFFDESMRATLTARMDLEQRLWVAIREERFRFAFQPKGDITNGKFDAFEALIRWVEHDGSIRMPGEFIELASELGSLDDITRFALRDVVRNIPLLSAQFGAHITVSTNVAAPQAGDVTSMRSLITAIHDRSISQGILKGIESLCIALGIEVVAESVETIEELEYLHSQTTLRLVQGYYFSKPVFIEVLEHYPNIVSMDANINAPMRIRA